MTGNSAGLGTALFSLSHRELRSSLRESHIFLSLPVDTTMASSQGTPCLAIHSADEHRLIYSCSNTTSYSTFYAFFFFFSDDITVDVASRQQKTDLFLSTIVTRTRRHTELTQKTDKPGGKPVVCQRTFISVFRAVFFTQLKCTV